MQRKQNSQDIVNTVKQQENREHHPQISRHSEAQRAQCDVMSLWISYSSRCPAVGREAGGQGGVHEDGIYGKLCTVCSILM
jgi:hypothetical protein